MKVFVAYVNGEYAGYSTHPFTTNEENVQIVEMEEEFALILEEKYKKRIEEEKNA